MLPTETTESLPDDDIMDDMPDIPSDAQGEMYEHYRFTADKGQTPLRIDKFLTVRTEGVSRNRIQQAAEAGCILANGKQVKSNYKVKPGDVITVVMDRPRYETEIIPEDIPINVVYEDSELMVVNKPAGLVVHPGHGNYTGTLVNALAYYFRDDKNFDVSDPRLGLVHRIDKDTSGLLVIAKTPIAKTSLGRQFFEKTTDRKYFALVNAAWACLPERAQAKLKTPENFRKYVEVAAGHCETFYHPRLREFVEIPKSIAFDSMDGAAFEDMYGRVRAVIDSLLGPVLSPEEFDRILLNF